MMATKLREPSKCAAALMPREPNRQWMPVADDKKTT